MISVVIPAYNVARYLGSAVQSVLDQKVDCPVEVLIVDDGSTDDTAKVMTDLAARDPRIRLFHQANMGVSAARNRLLASLSPECEFVTFLDGDDAFPDGRFQRHLDILRHYDRPDVVYGEMRLVDDHAVLLADALRPTDFILRGIQLGAGTYRRALIEKTGAFGTDFVQGEDLDYLIRIFEQRPNYRLIGDVGLYYRQRDGSATNDKDGMRRGVLQAMLAHGRRRRATPDLGAIDGIFDLRGDARTAPLPEYSVVIPAFNAARFLPATMDSVFGQSHPPQQVIVVNDGSTDNTADVLGQTDLTLTVIHQHNAGPGAATNAGLAVAQCDFVAFLDAGDLWQADKMAIQLRHLMANPRLSGVVARMQSFADDDRAPTVDDRQSGWSRSTLLMRRTALDALGPIADFGRKPGEMVDFFARAREAGHVIDMIPDFLALRRLHRQSMTAGHIGDQRAYLEVVRQAMRRKRANRAQQA